MRGRDTRWTWSRVGVIHGTSSCNGEIRSYQYRYYPPSDSSYERCVGLAWCSICRECSSAMVYVPRAERLPDLLAGLPAPERERLGRSDVKLLDYLDRLARRGEWPLDR